MYVGTEFDLLHFQLKKITPVRVHSGTALASIKFAWHSEFTIDLSRKTHICIQIISYFCT